MATFYAYLPWPAWLPLACLLVQFYYAARYFWPLANRPPETAPPAPAGPLSVLVCARNELENLRELLPLLLQQDHPALEIVLIDDRSRDDTYLYAQQLAQYYPERFRLVTVTHTPANFAPKKYALTLGIKAARHPQLLFTDADCRPASPQWAARMQAGFGAASGGGAGIDIVLGASFPVPAPGFLNRLVRYETLLTAAQYLGFAQQGQPYMGVGRNLAYTRAAFWATKGFVSHIRRLSGDDDLLVQDAVSQGLRAVVVADPPAQTTTQAPATWAAWWRQKRRHLSAGTRYRPADRARIGIFLAANGLFYLSIAGGACFPQAGVSLAAIGAVRTFLITVVYAKTARRLGQPLPFYWLPLLDFVYFIQYFALGLSLSVNRRLQWK